MPWCERSDGARVIELLRNDNPDLRELDLSNKDLGDSDAMALGEALKTNAALQTLNLRGNSVGAAGTAHAVGRRGGVLGVEGTTHCAPHNSSFEHARCKRARYR